ncbi:MAG: glycosyltransferase, partial [Nitrospirae bacterium]|nr:glycosyltransferase [Nitrospirota bacterium]
SSHDAVVVGYLGHFDMFLARPLASLRGKPLIFDAFLSLYNTVIEDRKLFRPGSLPARFLLWTDRTACRMADRVLLDTEAHIEYFVKTFRLPREKFHRVFVGAEEGLFYPCEEREYAMEPRAARRLKPAATLMDGGETPSSPEPEILAAESCFRVLFYGQFIPLHGIETIIRAAKILEGESVAFTLIGKGQESEKIRRLVKESGLTRIRWEEWVPYRDLRDYICGTDAGLGIFGETEKASQVIPNKAFQIIACRRPLITGDSSAARELFADGESAVLCKMADPVSLAHAILRLKNDPELRSRVADGGYRVFQERCRFPLSESLFFFVLYLSLFTQIPSGIPFTLTISTILLKIRISGTSPTFRCFLKPPGIPVSRRPLRRTIAPWWSAAMP